MVLDFVSWKVSAQNSALTGFVILWPTHFLKAVSRIFGKFGPRTTKIGGQFLLIFGIRTVLLQNIGTENQRDLS